MLFFIFSLSICGVIRMTTAYNDDGVMHTQPVTTNHFEKF